MVGLQVLLTTVALSTTLLEAKPILDRRAALSDCLSNIAGAATTLPGSSNYDSASAAYNQRVQPSPAAVVVPSSISQLRAVIACARSNGVPVSARGGGHSYASYGLGDVNTPSVVVDMQKFNTIQVNENEHTATIGGGQRLGDIYLALNDKGQGFPAGTCPFVGAGGHFGYGGYGFAARWQGLAVDRVIGYNVMLPNGTFIQNLTPQRDSDLFWALAGSASSFGIVTAYHVKTFDAPSQAVMFKYNYNGASVQTLTKAFFAFQSWGLTKAPGSLGIAAVMSPGGNLELSGVQYGVSRDQFNSVISSLTSTLPAGYDSDVHETDWIGSLKELANGQNLDTTGQQSNRDTFFAKSLMTPSDKPLTEQALTSFFNFLSNKTPDTSKNTFVMCDLYGGQNSAINKVSLDQSSFGTRSSLLTCQFYTSSPTYGLPWPSDSMSYVNNLYGSLVDPIKSTWGSSIRAYTNYIDPTLDEQTSKSLYWGSQYDRLSRVKSRVDPSQVFRFKQSIKPSGQ
ncbi:hypothetical protein OIO90_004667 [Microbotryomycetes sp. JL221]|nr:hypothetical protein OIO90_004667 [Microbotryomycetes sp. JL221]